MTLTHALEEARKIGGVDWVDIPNGTDGKWDGTVETHCVACGFHATHHPGEDWTAVRVHECPA